MSTVCNIASILPQMAAQRGRQVAMVCPGAFGDYSLKLTYLELENRSNAIAHGLKGIGIQRGHRVVVMVRPTPEFFLLMFALFKLGAVPVMVDPGIERAALKQCLDEAEPQAFIGIPLAHFGRFVYGWAQSAKIAVTVGTRWFWGGHRLKTIERDGTIRGPMMTPTQPDEVAAILFTSGSTGVPKGVVYRHRHFMAQVDLLRRAMKIKPGGVNLPTFPPFALFDPALGLTSVIPDMDPTRPAQANPDKLIDAMAKFGVDQLFGSPALVRVLAEHGEALPELKKVMSAGAPVPPDVVGKMSALMEDGELFTPYGATECLPVSVIEGRELQRTRAATENGAGTCVGRPVEPNVVRIIRISDQPIPYWAKSWELPVGSVGEITVAGPTATDEYFRRGEATRLAKIRERVAGDEERVVHRMGDLGYLDAEGRLWFCGRKSHRVESPGGLLTTEQVEPIFNTHPEVRRTALVGLGQRGLQTPVLCVELKRHTEAERVRERIKYELAELANRTAQTQRVRTFLFHPGFPVDIRHNAKIGREKLTLWAAKQLGVKA